MGAKSFLNLITSTVKRKVTFFSSSSLTVETSMIQDFALDFSDEIMKYIRTQDWIGAEYCLINAVKSKEVSDIIYRCYSKEFLNHLVYDRKMQVEDTVSIFKRVINLTQERFGLDDDITFEAICKLITYLQTKQELLQAEIILQTYLNLLEQHYGQQHIKTLAPRHYLADFLLFYQKPYEAKPLYETCLQIKEEHYGKESISLTFTLNFLASCYEANGSYSDAMQLYDRMVDIWEKAYRANQEINISNTNYQMSFLFHFARNYPLAADLWNRAVSVHRKSMGQQNDQLDEIIGLYERLNAAC